MARRVDYGRGPTGQISRSSGSGGAAGASGKVDFGKVYKVEGEFGDLHQAWANSIDNLVNFSEPFAVKSPYATITYIKALTGITKAADATVSAVAHGLSVGDYVLITSCDASEIEGYTVRVTTVADDTFTIGLNSSAWSAAATVGYLWKLVPNTAYSPDTEITAAETKLTAYTDAVTALDPAGATGDWFDAVTRGVATANVLYTDDDIDDAVEAYERKINAMYGPRVGAFCSGMADVNAVNTSSFAMGLALMELDKRRDVQAFHAGLRIEAEKMRMSARIAGASEISLMQRNELDHLKSSAFTKSEWGRLKIGMLTEEKEFNRTMKFKHDLWELDRFGYGGNFLATIFGAVNPVPSTEGPDKPSAIASGLTYAATGAMIGNAIVPGGVGAGIGAVIGLAGGLFA